MNKNSKEIDSKIYVVTQKPSTSTEARVSLLFDQKSSKVLQ